MSKKTLMSILRGWFAILVTPFVSAKYSIPNLINYCISTFQDNLVHDIKKREDKQFYC